MGWLLLFGGVDSSTLAAVSFEVLRGKAVAVIAKSPTYTCEELENAKRIAQEIGIKLFIIETNELENPNFNKNPENRCYFCKKRITEKPGCLHMCAWVQSCF